MSFIYKLLYTCFVLVTIVHAGTNIYLCDDLEKQDIEEALTNVEAVSKGTCRVSDTGIY
jgi:hypothetical protein